MTMKRVYSSNKLPTDKKTTQKLTIKEKFNRLTLNQILGTFLCIMLFITAISGALYIVFVQNAIPTANNETNKNTTNQKTIESPQKTEPVQETVQKPISKPETIKPTIETKEPSIKKLDIKYEGPQLYENSILDTNHLVTVLTYDDNTTKTISANELEFITDVTNPLVVGENTIKIKYKDCEWTFKLNVNEKDFVTKAIETYNSEIENSDYKYISDNTFITIKKYTDPDVYWLAHIVINDLSQFAVQTAYGEFNDRQTSLFNEQQFGWTLGINASYFDNANQVLPGIYINKDKIFQTTDDNCTTGKEMFITDNGLMFTAEPGTPLETLQNAGVMYTVLSGEPTLIVDGKLQKIEHETKSPKTAIGQVSPNEYYMIAASDGSYFTDVTYEKIQQIFNEKNCQYAKAVDGSTNTSMMLNEKTINNPACGPGRPLKDLMVIYDVPSKGD